MTERALPPHLHLDTLAVRAAVEKSQYGENSVALYLSSSFVQPDSECEHTTWSPAFKRPMHIIKMADMPDDVPMAASVPSRAAKRSSMLVTVGLP